MDVHVIGVGKDQYNEYLDQMVEGRVLPWTEDSQSEDYPVWTDWEAAQRDVFFLNRNGIVDTTFSITPYDPGNPDDYTYIMNLILDLRNEICDSGFMEIEGICFNSDDIAVLQEFIDNSYESGIDLDCEDWDDYCGSPNPYMDSPDAWFLNIVDGQEYYFADGDGIVEPLELGIQEWENGRLTSIMCGAYIYCQLSGPIPENINELTEIEQLRLEYNYLSDYIPEDICDLDVNYSDNLSFDITGNYLCPPYPECIDEYVGYQDTSNCDQGSVTVDYQSGWNIVGLPLEVEDANYQILFPNAQSGTLYSFEGTYQPEETIEQGTGYLLKLTSDGPVGFTGTPTNELTISLSEGWNLFSGLSTSLLPEDIYAQDIIQNGTIYGLDAVYYSPESIDPGMGYWVRATQDGEITLFSTVLAIKTVEQVNHLSDANTLELSSGAYSNTLFFGKDVLEGEMLKYSLPPTFPKMAFDARFTDDMKVVLESGEIEVLNKFETLTVEYNIKIHAGEHMNWVLTSGSGGQFVLEGSGEITVTSEERFTLNRVPELPDTFTLNQNYPNPFNNKTSIHYYLPVDGNVIVRIYNLSGILVNTLVNTDQIFGYHTVTWDGMDFNNNPVSSGIYMYNLSAGGKILTSKCVLLK